MTTETVPVPVYFGGFSGTVPAGVTDYLYDGQQIIEERNDAAPTVWTQLNFWGQYIDELLFFAIPTATVYRVVSDLLYRSVALVDTSNNIIEAYDCDAYGNTLCYSGPGTDGLWFTDDDVPTFNPINLNLFTGRQYDPESEIYYYRARYYAPTMGRFISRDPLGSPIMTEGATEPFGSAELSQGPNLYWYVQNNPANRVDPSGLIAPICTNDGPLPCPNNSICTWVCICPPGTTLDRSGSTIFTREDPCDANPESRFPEKCNKQISYRTLALVGLGILTVAGAVATVASFGGFGPVEAGLIGATAATGL